MTKENLKGVDLLTFGNAQGKGHLAVSKSNVNKKLASLPMRDNAINKASQSYNNPILKNKFPKEFNEMENEIKMKSGGTQDRVNAMADSLASLPKYRHVYMDRLKPEGNVPDSTYRGAWTRTADRNVQKGNKSLVGDLEKSETKQGDSIYGIRNYFTDFPVTTADTAYRRVYPKLFNSGIRQGENWDQRLADVYDYMSNRHPLLKKDSSGNSVLPIGAVEGTVRFDTKGGKYINSYGFKPLVPLLRGVEAIESKPESGLTTGDALPISNRVLDPTYNPTNKDYLNKFKTLLSEARKTN